ncbi:MAG: alpha/beta hydrolase [Planctomycetes bacterium]|nr:alpha/beta hydrolase [Planctomycetota bacterium]
MPPSALILLTLASAVPLLAQAAAAPAPPTTAPASTPRPDPSPVVLVGSRIAWNIPYVANAAPEQRLDVYAPAKATKAPVVLFVHGGEWAKGDKSEVSWKPKFLVENGIVLVSVNYRLSGTAPHPAQVDDVAAAVRWTKDHIAEHGGDPQQVFVLGHSAGTHLAALLGLDARPLGKVGLAPTDLAGVLCWSGSAYDLIAKLAEGGDNAPYIVKAFGAAEVGLRDASPLAHVRAGQPAPRFLVAVAGQSTRGNAKAAATGLVAAMHAAGLQASLVELEGKTHYLANHELGMPNGGEALGAVLLGFVRSDATPR